MFAANTPYSEKKAAEVFACLVKNNTWVCPTLLTRRGWDSNVVKPDSRLKYLPLSIRDQIKDYFIENTKTEEVRNALRKLFERKSATTGRAGGMRKAPKRGHY
jgi:hypothetical protein